MPQISQLAVSWLSQVFWLAVTFGIVFLVVGRGMLPRVQKTIDARDTTIAQDLAAASRARDEADKAEEAWRARDQANRERAQAVVADARARAARATEESLRAANGEQAAQIAAREADIRSATDRALTEIEDVAAEAARDIVSRISGAEVSVEEAMGAVRAVMQGSVAHG